MFLKLTPPSAGTPTPLRSTYRGSSLSPQFLSFALLHLGSSLALPVVFFFLSGERPVKSAVYYVFRSHPDKNTRHARTTHSALSSYLFLAPRFLLATFLPLVRTARQERGFATPGISRPRDFGSRGRVWAGGGPRAKPPKSFARI